MVGKSPAANAVALKAWLAYQPNAIDRVILLETHWAKSSGASARLGQWITREVCTEVDHVPLPAGLRELRDVVQTALGSDRTGQSPPVSNVAAGMRSFIVTIAAAMPAGTRFLSPNPIGGYCRVQVFEPRETTHRIALADLGVRTLLDLWGGCKDYAYQGFERPNEDIARIVERDHLAADEWCDPRTVWNLEMQLASGGAVRFDAARESFGQLITISVRREVPNRERGAAAKAERALLSEGDSLGGLMVAHHVVCDWRDLSNRLTESRRVRCIDVRSDQRPDWREQQLTTLRALLRPAAATLQPENDSTPAVAAADSSGKGGDATPRLLLFLGADPSTTLVSLCTHRPIDAWIGFDASPTGERVRAARDRFLKELTNIPVSRVHWAPTNISGSGIGHSISNAWADGGGGRIDVTPGTKEQALALSRVPGAELWSLVAHQGHAESLVTGESIRLEGPPIAVQARCCGGPLRPAGGGRLWNGVEMREHADRYARLAKAFETPDLRWNPDYARSRWMGDDEAPAHWRGWPRADDDKRVSRLFEEAVAWRLLQHAGADEVVVAVEWQFARNNDVRDEIDVVARFGGVFVSVECKAWMGKNPNATSLNEHFKFHRGRTTRGLGRFAIPLLVLLRQPQEQVAADTDLWTFSQLSTPAQARSLVGALIRSKSTMVPEET
ncbi:MAG: hypothetical protein ABS52_07770 [Gemmatimonadetes bacterium SCN 70-22]|nr:MAG: hypothetical protein ABS52_07770 [Gemmatimonadetes bacterium SCN 70-22]